MIRVWKAWPVLSVTWLIPTFPSPFPSPPASACPRPARNGAVSPSRSGFPLLSDNGPECHSFGRERFKRLAAEHLLDPFDRTSSPGRHRSRRPPSPRGVERRCETSGPLCPSGGAVKRNSTTLPCVESDYRFPRNPAGRASEVRSAVCAASRPALERTLFTCRPRSHHRRRRRTRVSRGSSLLTTPRRHVTQP